MESFINFTDLALEIENIKYLQEQKQNEFDNLDIISNNLSSISITKKINKHYKKNCKKTSKKNKNNDRSIIQFNGVKKKKIIKSISKHEVYLYLNPKESKIIPFIENINDINDFQIIDIILKLPRIVEDSCYQISSELRNLLPTNLNSLYKKKQNEFRKDNFETYKYLKYYLLSSIFITTCQYFDKLNKIKIDKECDIQGQNNIDSIYELQYLFTKNKIEQFNNQIQFMFYQINEDIILDADNETYNDLDDYTKSGLILLKKITLKIIKIIKKESKIENMKFKKRLELMIMIFNFCSIIKYLLHRYS